MICVIIGKATAAIKKQYKQKIHELTKAQYRSFSLDLKEFSSDSNFAVICNFVSDKKSISTESLFSMFGSDSSRF